MKNRIHFVAHILDFFTDAYYLAVVTKYNEGITYILCFSLLYPIFMAFIKNCGNIKKMFAALFSTVLIYGTD